jgi:hypothetical protein
VSPIALLTIGAAIACWLAVAFWSARYLRAAGRLSRWIDANAPALSPSRRAGQPWVRAGSGSTVLDIVLFSEPRRLPDDAQFHHLRRMAAEAVWYVILFATLAFFATALVPIDVPPPPGMPGRFHNWRQGD